MAVLFAQLLVLFQPQLLYLIQRLDVAGRGPTRPVEEMKIKIHLEEFFLCGARA